MNRDGFTKLIRAVETFIRGVEQPPLVRRSATTLHFPGLLAERVGQFQLSDILLVTRHTPLHKLEDVYEQVMWIIYNKSDRGTLGLVRSNVQEQLGVGIATLTLQHTAERDQAALAIIWAISHVAGVPLVVDDNNCYVTEGSVTLGVKDGVLQSAWIKDVTLSGCRKTLSKPWPRKVRNSQRIVGLKAVARSQEEHDILALAVTAAGTVAIDTLVRGIEEARGTSWSQNDSLKLHKRCSEFINNDDCHPLLRIKQLLVPTHMSSTMFHQLFGELNKTRLPGKRKRSKLQTVIDSFFSVKSEKNNEN